ncbi:MAG: hypothetical protein COZ08_08825, partial [Bacteroidetes bacterium CG_4_10_14_3_um_filter_42_6]
GGTSLLKSIHLNHATMDVAIIGNFDVIPGSVNPAFQKAGIWYDFFSNDSIDVINVNETRLLQPGEFHIYTTKKLNQGTYLDIDETFMDRNTLMLYPNPTDDALYINATGNIMQMELFDVQGQLVEKVQVNHSSETVINTQTLKKGFYVIYALMEDGQTAIQKFIKK